MSPVGQTYAIATKTLYNAGGGATLTLKLGMVTSRTTASYRLPEVLGFEPLTLLATEG